MIADALEWLREHLRPALVLAGGRHYGTMKLELPPLPQRLAWPKLELTSLQALVQYLEENRDGLERGELMVHVGGPAVVELLYSVEYLDEEDGGRCPYRESIAVVKAPVAGVQLNTFVEREAFQIMLASRFAPGGDRDALLRVVGNLEAGATRTHRDDGIAQEVTVRSGVATKESTTVPPIVFVAPYRTFPEVAQPGSSFLFRIKDGGDAIACALFEADGGAWQIEARQRVAGWLEDALAAKSIDVPVLR